MKEVAGTNLAPLLKEALLGYQLINGVCKGALRFLTSSKLAHLGLRKGLLLDVA